MKVRIWQDLKTDISLIISQNGTLTSYSSFSIVFTIFDSFLFKNWNSKISALIKKAAIGTRFKPTKRLGRITPFFIRNLKTGSTQLS